MLGLILYSLILCGVSSGQNLIKSGDFEDYTTYPWIYTTLFYNGKAFPMQYSLIFSNTSDWYDKSMGKIQIQNSYTEYTTTAVDLSSTVPITLCQNVVLIAGNKYTLSFDLYSSLRCQKMLGKAYLNDVLLTSVYIPTNSTFRTQVYTFYADRNINTICFNETHSGAPPFAYMPNVGGFIDNITLFFIEKQHIMFNYILNQIDHRILLEGNSTFNDILAKNIENQYDLYVNGKPISYMIKYSDKRSILIEIKEEESFNLNTIKFVKKFNNSQTFSNTTVEISILPSKKNFYYLKQSQVKILTQTKNLLSFINALFSKVSSFCQLFLFAYIINTIIGIEFLSLFYIFNQIEVLPDFTSKIYHEVLKIIFSSKSIIEYSLDIFKISIKNFDLDIENQFKEKIQDEKNEEPWFGTYNLSSKVIKSNFNNIVLIILSSMKFGLVKLILKLIGKFCPSFLNIKMNIFSEILTQFCFLLPIILISVMANVIDAVRNNKQTGYKIGCLLFIYISLMCLFLYISLPTFNKKIMNKRLKKKQKKRLNKKSTFPLKINSLILEKEQGQKQIEKQKKYKSKKIQKKILKNYDYKERKVKDQNKQRQILRIYFNEQAFSMLMLFFIPLMSVVGNSKLFLAINTLSVLFRFFGFLKFNYQNDLLIQRVIDFLIGLVWLIHHSIFVCFFFFSEKVLSENEKQTMIIFGIAAVFTITAITILQSIKISILILKFIKECFTFLLTNFNKLNKEQKQKQKKSKGQIKLQRQTIFIEVIKNKIKREKSKRPNVEENQIQRKKETLKIESMKDVAQNKMKQKQSKMRIKTFNLQMLKNIQVHE